MKDRRSIGVHARALFAMAKAQGALDGVQVDLEFLGRLCGSNAEWRAFLHQPVLPAAQREAALRELFEGRVQELTLRLLLILSGERGLLLLPDIAERFGRLYRKAQDIVSVSVLTAVPLDGEAESALRRRLSAKYGERMEMKVGVDPSLLGGLQIRVGHTVYDHSVAGELEKLKHSRLLA